MRTNKKFRSRKGPATNTAAKRRNTGKQGPKRGGFKPSELDPNLLVKKAEAKEVKHYRSERTFSDMPINGALKLNLNKKGFTEPTEIQDRSIDLLIKGRDLLGIANTGTGKTGAFLIPTIDGLLADERRQALVVVPTRELAIQVQEEFRSMSKGMNLYDACFIGGTNINKDLKKLQRNSHVVIGTPGRLLDLMERRALRLGKFNTLVLDEYDRMLDMGFIKDVQRILDAMPGREHTMLFSATMDPKQRSLINGILRDPITVQVSDGQSTADHVDQDIIRIQNGQDKFEVLNELLAKHQMEKVLVFEETKHRVKRLTKKLNATGIKSGEIHGNRSQAQRQAALKSFKEGKLRVLVATDVAARGLDISNVTHVINYQVPQTYDAYIHRIGRTGRAGKTGKAFTLVG